MKTAEHKTRHRPPLAAPRAADALAAIACALLPGQRLHQAEAAAQAALLGRGDRQAADRRIGAVGLPRGRSLRGATPARGSRCSASPPPSPTAARSAAPSTSPRCAMETLREHGTIPFLSWASQSVPSSLNQPDYKLSTIINGSHDAYIRRIRRRRAGLGPPLLPPLRRRDERLLVPLERGRQRQQAGPVRRRLAPRPRHLHPGRRHQRDLGLVPQRRLHQAT